MKWALVAPEYSVEEDLTEVYVCLLLFVSITLFAFATVVHEVLFFLYKYLWI